ncbi:RbsD/FucU family protein [Mesorhizobium sp. 10J20-29]
MLIGIPDLLGPEFLATLRAMGHGDELAIVDANYPAVAHGHRVLRADGHSLIDVIDAVLAVLPVDDAVPQALFRAAPAGDAEALDPVHVEIVAACQRRAPGREVVALAGQAFYDRVRSAFAVVATGERRLYANFIVRKGVIHPGRVPDNDHLLR